MRWLLGSITALLLAWTVYLASPYWSAAQFASAIERGDVEAIASRVNLHALRLSVAKQLADEGIAAAELQAALASTDLLLAAGAAAVVADPVVGRLASARGVIELAREARLVQDGAPAKQGWFGRVATAADYVSASRWRGFRNVYFHLPQGRPPVEQLRLQFRLSRLQWRLVSIDLPVELRRRLLARIANLKGVRP
jgi:hypothetical protein